MNNKGFTLVELLATLVILALVIGISVAAMNFNLGDAKEKTEEVFVDTIKDALDIYLSSDAKKLSFVADTKNDGTNCVISKKYGNVKVEKAIVTFKDVINSGYKPMTEDDLVNPANEDVECNVNASVTIYRDEDFVYYYSINKSGFGCLLNNSSKVKEEFGDGTKIYYSDVISNLPEGYDCD